MKINHKKLNVVLGVIILGISLFLIHEKVYYKFIKQEKNIIGRGKEQEFVKLANLRYKDIFDVKIEKYDNYAMKSVNDFVRHPSKNDLEVYSDEIKSFGLKHKNLIVKGILIKRVPIALRTDADVVILDVIDAQKQRQRFILTFEYLCSGAGCGWIYRQVEDAELKEIVIKFLNREYPEK